MWGRGVGEGGGECVCALKGGLGGGGGLGRAINERCDRLWRIV